MELTLLILLYRHLDLSRDNVSEVKSRKKRNSKKLFADKFCAFCFEDVSELFPLRITQNEV